MSNIKTKLKLFSTNAMNWFTGIIAFGTILMAGFGWWQIKIFKEFNSKQLAEMNKATELEHRAFIQVRVPKICMNYDSIYINEILLETINTGNTPTDSIRVYAIWTNDPMPDNFTDDMYNKGGETWLGNLGANQNIPIRLWPNNLTIEDYITQKKSIFYYGIILYNDFFKKHHYAHFYFHIKPGSRTNYSTVMHFRSDWNNPNQNIYQPMNKYNDAN